VGYSIDDRVMDPRGALRLYRAAANAKPSQMLDGVGHGKRPSEQPLPTGLRSNSGLPEQSGQVGTAEIFTPVRESLVGTYLHLARSNAMALTAGVWMTGASEPLWCFSSQHIELVAQHQDFRLERSL
jgi:hypothetical protein